MELIIKNPTIPLKAYNPDALETQLDAFSQWVTHLLSLTGVESAKKLISALPAIKEQFWSMGFEEVKKAFEMYADGKLDIKPRSNYFDRILVGQIFSAYKSYQRTLNRPKAEPTKEEIDYLHCVTAYDHYISTGTFYLEMTWLYEYLEDFKEVIEWSREDKEKAYNHFKKQYEKDRAVQEAKAHLLMAYFDRLNNKGSHIKHLL